MATRRIVKNAARRRRRMIAFGWYGGKYSHLDFILPNLPNDADHFCDVFGGSAAVIINRGAGAGRDLQRHRLGADELLPRAS